MSPALTFPHLVYGLETSWKFLKSRKYSFSQHFQKASASFCVLWCAFVRYNTICGSVPEGNAVSLSPINLWINGNVSVVLSLQNS